MNPFWTSIQFPAQGTIPARNADANACIRSHGKWQVVTTQQKSIRSQTTECTNTNILPISTFNTLKSHARLTRIWSKTHKTILYTVHLLTTHYYFGLCEVEQPVTCTKSSPVVPPIAKSPLYPARHKYHPKEISHHLSSICEYQF